MYECLTLVGGIALLVVLIWYYSNKNSYPSDAERVIIGALIVIVVIIGFILAAFDLRTPSAKQKAIACLAQHYHTSTSVIILTNTLCLADDDDDCISWQSTFRITDPTATGSVIYNFEGSCQITPATPAP